MKTIALIRLFVPALVFFSVLSCRDQKPPVSNFSGSLNEVLVISVSRDSL